MKYCEREVYLCSKKGKQTVKNRKFTRSSFCKNGRILTANSIALELLVSLRGSCKYLLTVINVIT